MLLLKEEYIYYGSVIFHKSLRIPDHICWAKGYLMNISEWTESP